ADELIEEGDSSTQPARGGLYKQQSQLSHGFRVPHQEDRADRLAVALGNPASLALFVKALKKGPGDFRHQALKGGVPPILLRVQCAMARDHPANIARLVGAYGEAGLLAN